MKIINAAVRSNGKLAQVLATRRDNGFHAGTIKRQSSRQMRQRLGAELRQQVDGIFLEAMEVAKTRRIYNRWSSELKATFGVAFAAPQQASAAAKVVRQVQVVRKLAGSPYARKQLQVAALAA